jgi:type III secretion system YscI/HrpB-like protein
VAGIGISNSLTSGAHASSSPGLASRTPGQSRDLQDSARQFAQVLAQAEQVKAQPVAPVVQSAETDAKDRAKRALQLDTPTKPVDAPNGTADTILDGMQKLRGVFDAQQHRVLQAMAAPATNPQTLLAVQLEVVNYSVLVDVTSKLTGKSTQAFETLLKGQ